MNVKRWFLHAALYNKEEKQIAHILSILIEVTWTVYLVVVLLGLYWRDWKLVVVALAGSILLTAPFWLIRRGHLTASSLVVMLSTLGTVTIFATVGQGIRDLAILAYPIIFIFSSLTLSRMYLRLCVGLTFAAICWLAIGEANGWFATLPYPEDPSNWIYLISTTVILLVAALAVDLLATNMRKNLELAHTEIARRLEIEEELRESEEKYRTLFDKSPVGTGIATIDGKVLSLKVL